MKEAWIAFKTFASKKGYTTKVVGDFAFTNKKGKTIRLVSVKGGNPLIYEEDRGRYFLYK